MKKIIEMIKRHEGFSRYPYKDSLGVLTIGYGFNLDHWLAYGITKEEADALLKVKVEIAKREASELSGWEDCNEVRQAVLIDMVYNMGIRSVKSFKKMLAALEQKDYKTASFEMLDSRWARQVGVRAVELSEMMRTGLWPKKRTIK